MSRCAGSWAKRLMVATAFTTYMMPGCNGLMNNPNFQSLVDSTLSSGDFELEFSFEGDAGNFTDGHFEFDSNSGHDDSDDDLATD